MRGSGADMTALLLVLLSSAPADCPVELFRIERSKNANVVVYEARRGPQSPLDPDEPLTASWIMLAKGGQRQSLNFFERLFAYGFDVKLGPQAQSAQVTLKALKDRTIRVAPRDGCLAAFGVVAGAETVLKRIFVTTDEHGAAPSVLSIELFGVDAATGEARSEKLVAGK